jgi:hypothetical protein
LKLRQNPGTISQRDADVNPILLNTQLQGLHIKTVSQQTIKMVHQPHFLQDAANSVRVTRFGGIFVVCPAVHPVGLRMDSVRLCVALGCLHDRLRYLLPQLTSHPTWGRRSFVAGRLCVWLKLRQNPGTISRWDTDVNPILLKAQLQGLHIKTVSQQTIKMVH